MVHTLKKMCCFWSKSVIGEKWLKEASVAFVLEIPMRKSLLTVVDQLGKKSMELLPKLDKSGDDFIKNCISLLLPNSFSRQLTTNK